MDGYNKASDQMAVLAVPRHDGVTPPKMSDELSYPCQAAALDHPFRAIAGSEVIAPTGVSWSHALCARSRLIPRCAGERVGQRGVGAGDGTRTHDVQLGKLFVDSKYRI